MALIIRLQTHKRNLIMKRFYAETHTRAHMPLTQAAGFLMFIENMETNRLPVELTVLSRRVSR